MFPLIFNKYLDLSDSEMYQSASQATSWSAVRETLKLEPTLQAF